MSNLRFRDLLYKWFANRGRKREADLDDEIQAHLRMALQDRIERGEDPDAATKATRVEFGNVGMIKERTREMWGWSSFERAVQDFRYATWTLRRTPGSRR